MHVLRDIGIAAAVYLFVFWVNVRYDGWFEWMTDLLSLGETAGDITVFILVFGLPAFSAVVAYSLSRYWLGRARQFYTLHPAEWGALIGLLAPPLIVWTGLAFGVAIVPFAPVFELWSRATSALLGEPVGLGIGRAITVFLLLVVPTYSALGAIAGYCIDKLYRAVRHTRGDARTPRARAGGNRRA